MLATKLSESRGMERLLRFTQRFLIDSSRVMLWLTWPGSFFHELAHQLACYCVGHRVLEVRYIVREDSENRAGYVVHQGPPGAGKHLLIGVAPLLLGLMLWAAYIGLALYFTRDGSLGLVNSLVMVGATLVAVNAAYHALPSPQDIENVFRQPFSATTMPCYLLAGPIWVISHNYRSILYGWTPWHVVVVVATIYMLYNVVAVNLVPALPDLPRLLV